MKRKLVLSIGFAGALALSVGFAKDFQNTKVYAQTNGDQFRVVSLEEQNRIEAMVSEGETEQATYNGDQYTVISVEEQNMVENSSAQQVFVPQENGTGFYFIKLNKFKFL
ncbi:hypothetical protein AB1282_20070 [Gottfriedia sp. S16(2024)]|uniref:hypothetical protein n=1 Tax=Gottfriedia sp. S16(2024) TaxID=3162883 RepID=UPI003D191D3C